jgi:hypothetical protein
LLAKTVDIHHNNRAVPGRATIRRDLDRPHISSSVTERKMRPESLLDRFRVGKLCIQRRCCSVVQRESPMCWSSSYFQTLVPLCSSTPPISFAFHGTVTNLTSAYTLLEHQSITSRAPGCVQSGHATQRMRYCDEADVRRAA